MNKRYLFLSLLLSVFVLAFILRFYKLGEIPNGLYQDETAIGYNAYSIMNTGKDEHGKYFPLYFKSFGDWKLPVYIYTTAVSVKLFGLNEFAVRFPSAFFGFLTVVIFYFFIKDLLRDRNIALLSAFLLSINPWSLHYNRATFEVSIGLFLFVFGGYLLNKFFRENRNSFFFLGTLSFILALYSYNLTRLLSPLIYILFIFYNIKNFKSVPKLEVYLTLFIGFIAILPFLFTLFMNGGASSASGTLIFSSSAVYAPLLEFRSYTSNLFFNLDLILFNKYFMIIWQYIVNIITYFNVPFFFINGSLHGNHGIGNAGLFYVFEIFTIIIGFYFLVRSKGKEKNVIFLWILIVILVASLTRDVPHATRSYFMLAPLIIISAAGLMKIFYAINKLNNKVYKYLFILIIIFIFSYNIAYYLSSYYLRFPIYYAKQWNSVDKELSIYINDNKHKYNKIVIDEQSDFKYTSYLFYTSYSPFEFLKTVRRTNEDNEGFVKVLSFGKFEFRKIDWHIESQVPRQLIVFSAKNKPDGVPEILRLNYPQRPVVISEKEKLYQFPVEEGAYVLVETK